MNDRVLITQLLAQVEAFRQRDFDHRVVPDADSNDLEILAKALNRLGDELMVSTAAKRVLTQLNSRLWSANKRLDEVSRIDPLTSLPNRRGLEAVLLQESERAMRQDSPCSAVLIDCDDFKDVNDVYGHSVGNQVLHEFAARMTAAMRTGDHIGRIGGDEFLAILPDTRFHEAMVAAERIRLGISHHPLRITDTSLEITASMGVTTLPLSMTSIDEALTLTRLGLKRSKVSGKNRVSGRPSPDANPEA
ncbi:MAG: diguanylate cyclase, partial [Myxococcota bacterium]|nr:diguanylate cyclase [Myxococcota bacterium]